MNKYKDVIIEVINHGGTKCKGSGEGVDRLQLKFEGEIYKSVK